MMGPRFTRNSLEGIRKGVADAVTSENCTAESLGDMAVHMAKVEGYVFAWETADRALNHELGGPQAALAELFDLLQRGPDDGWSGRGNDVRRARFDGIREAVRDLRFRLESQVERHPAGCADQGE